MHAYFFGKSRDAALSKEIGSLKARLEERDREAREEIKKKNDVLRSLEGEVRQKTEEVRSLRSLLSHQDAESRQLQGDTPELQAPAKAESLPRHRTAPSEATASAPAGFSQVARGASPHESDIGSPLAGEEKKNAGPAWKSNLDHILSLLDSMQKEIDK